MIPPMGYRGQGPVPRHGVLTSNNPFSPALRQLYGLSEPLVDTVRPYDSVALMYAPFIESLPGIPSEIGYRLSNITAPLSLDFLMREDFHDCRGCGESLPHWVKSVLSVGLWVYIWAGMPKIVIPATWTVTREMPWMPQFLRDHYIEHYT